jgi:hypothetical protein
MGWVKRQSTRSGKSEGGFAGLPNISWRARRQAAVDELSRHKRLPPHGMGPLHLFHGPIAVLLTAARAAMVPKRAIPPKTLSETSHDADIT